MTMSWFGNASSDENRSGFEVSEVMKPRLRPPPAQGVQSIARVQPLVPEVSMFHLPPQDVPFEPKLTVQPLGTGIGERKALGTINGQRTVSTPSNSEIRPALKAPTPTAAPTKAYIKATSEFSRVFQQTAEPSSLSVLSVFQDSPAKCGGESVSMPELTPPSRRPTSRGDYPSDPEEMHKMLTWQSEQLAKLREQVSQLLSFRETSQNTSIQSNSSLKQQHNTSVLADSSTQTSLPSTPVKRTPSHPAVVTDSPRLIEERVQDVSYVEINDLAPSVESSTQARVVEERVLKDMEEIQVVPLNSSPSNGPAAVTCRDLAPPEDIDKMISDHERKTRQQQQPPEPSMIAKLRDMGVSFINPSDLNQQARQPDLSIWHPRATEPSMLSTTESTSDFSLMLNSAALKYLSDEQLTHVARRTSSAATGTFSDNEVSFATNKYLNEN